MPRRTRAEKRMLKEQETVGALRETRKEMEELAGKKNTGGAISKAVGNLEGHEAPPAAGSTQPRHIARPGKPLKRR